MTLGVIIKGSHVLTAAHASDGEHAAEPEHSHKNIQLFIMPWHLKNNQVYLFLMLAFAIQEYESAKCGFFMICSLESYLSAEVSIYLQSWRESAAILHFFA